MARDGALVGCYLVARIGRRIKAIEHEDDPLGGTAGLAENDPVILVGAIFGRFDYRVALVELQMQQLDVIGIGLLKRVEQIALQKTVGAQSAQGQHFASAIRRAKSSWRATGGNSIGKLRS